MDVFFSVRVSLEKLRPLLLGDMHAVSEHARSPSRAFSLLEGFEQTLSRYLEYQNHAFYQAMTLEAQERHDLLKIADFLEKDLVDIKIEFLKFMDLYPSGCNSVRERNFPKDFLNFSRRIMERIQLEEEYFPLF